MSDKKSSSPPRHSIRGSALITVTFIGLFIMLVAAALVNSFATGEAQAIAHSLAKTRIYWASMGHINYALSRIQREGLCDGTCNSLPNNDDDGTPSPTDDALANRGDTVRARLFELGSGDSARQWEFGDGYNFTLEALVTDGPFPTPVANDGRVRMTVTLQPISGTPFDTLNGIEQRMRRNLVVDVCISAPCNTTPKSETNGNTLVEFLRRQ